MDASAARPVHHIQQLFIHAVDACIATPFDVQFVPLQLLAEHAYPVPVKREGQLVEKKAVHVIIVLTTTDLVDETWQAFSSVTTFPEPSAGAESAVKGTAAGRRDGPPAVQAVEIFNTGFF
jgi:hypothetical protein